MPNIQNMTKRNFLVTIALDVLSMKILSNATSQTLSRDQRFGPKRNSSEVWNLKMKKRKKHRNVFKVFLWNFLSKVWICEMNWLTDRRIHSLRIFFLNFKIQIRIINQLFYILLEEFLCTTFLIDINSSIFSFICQCHTDILFTLR